MAGLARRRFVLPAMALAAVLIAVALPRVSAGREDHDATAARRPASAAATTRTMFVDGGSVGGRCSDARSARQASSARTPWCSLQRAAKAAPATTASVAVRRGTYRQVSISAVRRVHWVTFAPLRGETVQLSGPVAIDQASHLRLRGFHIRSTATPSTITASDHIEISGSDISGQGIVVRNAQHVTIAANRIHDLLRPAGPESLAGYGIWANGYQSGARGERLSDLVIRRNVFHRIPQDGIQIGGGRGLVARILIDANTFDHVIRAVPEDHSDAIQILGGDGITIRANVIRQAEECLLVKDDVTDRLVLENNLMIGSPSMGHCAQIYDAPRARIVNNTFWQQATGWPRALVIGTAGRVLPTGTVLRNNIINRFQLQNRSWVQQDHNLIPSGPRAAADSGATPALDANWDLIAGSAGIDAANAEGAPARDRLGRVRHDDPAVADRGAGRPTYYDIGADERE